MNKKPSKKSFYAAIIGVFTPYLDFVLWPALILIIIIAWLSYRKYKKASHIK